MIAQGFVAERLSVFMVKMGDRGKRQIDPGFVAERFSALSRCNTHLHDVGLGLPIHLKVVDIKERAEALRYGVGQHVCCPPITRFHREK